ncbi:MAG: carbamoyltransferase HypF [Candidatus Cybelea sp.]
MSVTDRATARHAVRLHITGVVQGVGFRPFVYRVAQRHGVAGWVLNAEDGVHVVAEANDDAIAHFVDEVRHSPPPAAHVATFDVTPVAFAGLVAFEIRESAAAGAPTVRISPDLAVCADCLRELFDPSDRRFEYPYINCTNCGPRFSIVYGLPYDRPRTAMRDWPLCEHCSREYADPADRRFHAQPVACPACGPTMRLLAGDDVVTDAGAIEGAAALLVRGAIVAVKGIGGYHLACDAANAGSVAAMRERKYRKERPFALMARNLEVARTLVQLDASAESALTSIERPIVVAPAKRSFEGVAPENSDLGVMLAYTPVHHLLFAAGAPDVVVMTSANRSSEPIAYDDREALSSLAGIADAFLVGERPIARRIDDSVVRVVADARVVLRRARGLAPEAVATFPTTAPILALGGDLKNALTLVVDGQAFASQHIGDLDHLSARDAFVATVGDLCAMYEVKPEQLTVVHDLHPGYRSTEFARSLPGRQIGVQHHRAHVASVLAERGAWETRVVGFAFDGTGSGDDATIWGGEVFMGSLGAGLTRVGHLRPAPLPGGDAAARFPVQAAAGFLYDVDDGIDFDRPPFSFPKRYSDARALVKQRVRTFETTSMGRLFDTVAALVGFTREQSFEGQAAMWLEHLARSSSDVPPYALRFERERFDFRPMLASILVDRRAGRAPCEIARAFHAAVANAVVEAADAYSADRVVVSGGVFQNGLLLDFLVADLGDRLWFNVRVPANDGGLSLGQAAYAFFELERTS